MTLAGESEPLLAPTAAAEGRVPSAGPRGRRSPLRMSPEGRKTPREHAYEVHPLLDPLLPSRHPSVARRWLAAYHSIASDRGAARDLERSFVSPVVGGEQAPHQSIEAYFQDADEYVDDLLCHTSPAERQRLRPLPETRCLNGFSTLLATVFEAANPRVRYEAQRKLCLIKLLFDVDHCRSVRDGARHGGMLEELLRRSLWSFERDMYDLDCRIDGGGCVARSDSASVESEVGSRRFHVRRLAFLDGDVEVFHQRIRLKREPLAVSEEHNGEPPGERGSGSCWPVSRGRSGSILSKMIRKAIGDPRLIPDILGATFVVGDRRQAYVLERKLVQALGGPFRWRNRVDTLSGERERSQLDRSSAPGFRVLKQIADILVEDPGAGVSYFFPVEVQILPLEAYLLTLNDEDVASHAAYKRRQFAGGLFPILFPPEVFGAGIEPAEMPVNPHGDRSPLASSVLPVG